MNTKEEIVLKSIPQGSHKSELHIFINSLSNYYNGSAGCPRWFPNYFHTNSLTLWLLYKWLKITLNRPKLRGETPQKKELFHWNPNIGKRPAIFPWKEGTKIHFEHLKGLMLHPTNEKKKLVEPIPFKSLLKKPWWFYVCI